MKKQEAINNIDNMINRWWDLRYKKKLTENEIEELKGWSIKVEMFKIGTKVDDLTIKQYLTLTNEEWGDKAQKKMEEEIK